MEMPRIGPTERLFLLRTSGAMREVEPKSPTAGALIDARETLLRLGHYNAIALLQMPAQRQKDRELLFNDRRALTRVLILINKALASPQPIR